jgi:hypothetical protein
MIVRSSIHSDCIRTFAPSGYHVLQNIEAVAAAIHLLELNMTHDA